LVQRSTHAGWSVATSSSFSSGNKCIHLSSKFATEFVDVSGTGIVIFGLCPRCCSGMCVVEGCEFAQCLDQNRERTRIAFALRRFLPYDFEALFDVAHLLFGGAPETGNQLAACVGRIIARRCIRRR
jgi:hypothetical protein